MANLPFRELIYSIYNNPIGSKEYLQALKGIQALLKSKYIGENIMVIDSHELKKKYKKYQTNKNGKVDWSDELESDIFDFESSVFPSLETAHYQPRYRIEHDLRFKQVMVYGVVTLDHSVYMLRNHSHQITPIGGHVDFSRIAYNGNSDILMYNMKKEFDEEIEFQYKGKVLKSDDFNFTIDYVLNFNDDYYTLRNMAVVFRITPKDESIKSQSMEGVTKELHSHHAIKLDLRKYSTIISSNRFHGYAKHILRYCEQYYQHIQEDKN